MIAAVSPAEVTAPAAAEPTPEAAAPKPSPAASPTAAPVSGPSKEEWNEVRESSKDLSKRLGDLQEKIDKKFTDVEAGNKEIKAGYVESQEQLKLVQRLLDHIQNDQKKLEEHLIEVEKKVPV